MDPATAAPALTRAAGPRLRALARGVLLAAASLVLVACSSLRVQQGGARSHALQLDGLALAARASNTTREVVAMLALERACASARWTCAERILTAPGTIREGTRLVAAAEIHHRAAARARASERQAHLHACTQATRRYLHDADVAGREAPVSARSQLALRLHNACTAGLAADALSKGGPGAIDWQVDARDFPRAAVETVVLAGDVRVRGLRTRQVEDGLGVAAIAIGRTHTASGTFPAQPFALPLNLLAEPGTEGRLRVVAREASQPRLQATALGPIPLARDPSAAYALAAEAFERELGALRGLLGRRSGGDDAQIRLLAPVDRTRTPVVLVHGFASSPMTWANMVNELLGDPDIARHYQFWMARYATGYPVLVNRQQLAGALDGFRTRVFGGRGDCMATVLVGHSMGGVISRLLLTQPGSALWDTAFVAQPGALAGDAAARARALFFFDPLPGADELVMIAAPHAGSAHADSWLARLVQRLIRLPVDATGYLVDLARSQPHSLRPALLEHYRRGGIDSVATLSPGQPVMRAARELPVVEGVHIHSIVGIRNPRRPERGDGIVSLASATWPAGAVHHVTAGHDLQSTPATISILKRILLDRLQRQGDLTQTNCP